MKSRQFYHLHVHGAQYGVYRQSIDEVGHLTLVPLISGNLFRDMLNLQKQFHSFDGSNGGFGNGSRNTTSDEVLSEGKGISLGHFQLD